MGRINLTPLRVRKRALANLETRRTPVRPCWLEIISDVPPSTQTLVRPLPPDQTLTKVRTRSLPSPTQIVLTETKDTPSTHRTPQRKNPRKRSKLFQPLPIHYEEDTLRHTFYTDHPWELARPRTLLETTGDSHARTDWSTGPLQPNSSIPLSGESVVQRQLHLLHTVPDITMTQAYDIARKEFYVLRRQEETQRRIAAEEARAMGAEFGKSQIEIGMEIENAQYDDWERWSRMQVVEQLQKTAAFEGGTMPVEAEMLEESAVDGAVQEVQQTDGQGQLGAATGSAMGGIGSRVFAGERQRSAGLAGRSVME